jgi:hypothetical protein
LLDRGLFHIFTGADRASYVDSLDARYQRHADRPLAAQPNGVGAWLAAVTRV